MNKSNTTIDYKSPQSSSPEPAAPGFVSEMAKDVKIGILATIVLGIIVCGVYPVVVWGLSQALFHHQANGSLIGKDGQPVSKDSDAVGSSWIGQSFSAAQYFHPRPSNAGSGYDATASGGSNLGPTSAKLIHGTTKNSAFTVFAFDKSHPMAPVAGRVEGAVAAVTATTITITPAGTTTKMTYTLDPTVADPNTVVNSRGRTIHATTLAAPTHTGANVELKLNDKAPPIVTAINVIDQELDAASNTIDTTAKTITLPGDSPTVINIPDKALIIVNGKTDAKLGDITPDMSVHIVDSVIMDFDGVSDRVVHYCEDNNINYQISIPLADFKDADGIDDSKLIQELNSASSPTITPAQQIPADAVTMSGSGLDPHVSVDNARFQAQRVATARNVSLDKVTALIDQYTEKPSLGFLGDAGVNVLRLNLALDANYALPAAAAPAPTTAPLPAPTTAPTTNPATGK